MHLSYENQLKFKQNKMENIIKKYLKNNIILNNIVPSDISEFYRNKVTFQVEEKIGFYRENTYDIINIVRTAYPNIKIFLWTGYILEDLSHPLLKDILNKIDVLIDGPYVEEERDVTLKLRGSRNQRILLKEVDF
jgi:anaerobic ribonucleoside-triphosphate reductase activating protein